MRERKPETEQRKWPRRKILGAALAGAGVFFSLLMPGCGISSGENKPEGGKPSELQGETEKEAVFPDVARARSQMDEINGALTAQEITDAYRTTYEVFVYSFADADGDGIGDLPGLIKKLDYINDGNPETGEDLACSEIWLMPIFPSPTYHKYDATDYKAIDEQYGTMQDFDMLLSKCHERNVRVILDLAINHTSTEHPWFQTAAAYLKELKEGEQPSKEACPYVDYYVFSREKKSGYEPLSGADGWYYEARFWSGMPDLNLDSEAVRAEIADISAFWLDKGVDGFRMDAVTSYYTEDKTANIAFLSWFNGMVKEKSSEAYLVCEGWTDQSIYAQYYESGVDSMFDFAFSGQDGVIASVVKGNRKASLFAELMAEEEKLYASYNEAYVNAPFYTNHDMARSTGYYAYDDGSRTKLAGALNLLMTGNAFVYYGEELGMRGSGKDENKRAPMYWSAEASAKYICAGPPAMDTVKMKFPAFDEQAADSYSIYHYYRNAIALRNAFPVIARGKTIPAEAISGDEICAFWREMPDGSYQKILIVINASGEEKTVELKSLGQESDPSAENLKLSGVLTVSEAEVKLEGTSLTLPAFAVAVLN